MAKAKLNEVYEEIKKEARGELLKELQPKIERLKALGDEVLSSLSAFKSGRKTAVRRGRKPGPKPGRKPGRKPAAKKQVARAKRAPAGALNKAINDVLAKQQQPVGLVQIRNEVLKNSLFKKHDPKNLYNQIIQTIKKVKGVSKTNNGYTISK